MEKVYLVVVTVPDEETGERLAKALVQERLAACVNLIRSVRSIYSWKGELYDDKEALLWIKTRGGQLARLRERILALHPHEVPEIIAFPVTWGHEGYLSWVLGETGHCAGPAV